MTTSNDNFLMDVDSAIQKLEMTPGDVFFLHLPMEAPPELLREWTDLIQSWVDRRGEIDVRFVCVPKDFVLTRASTTQMEKLGWVRA